MNAKNFGLVKQNTCYEIQFQRKNPTFSPYTPGYKRIRPLSNAREGSAIGSRILSTGRGEVTVKVEEETNESQENQQVKGISMSVDNIVQETKSDTHTSQTKSLVPVLQNRVKPKGDDVVTNQFSVVSKSLDLRGSPESMRQLRNYIKSITNSQLSTFKDELSRLSEQNKCLREELTLHSDTISKLLDMTAEKNNLIADIKSRNSRLEQEIRIKNEINENFVALLKEVDDLKTKYLTNDEEKIKFFIKSYLKSKKDNHRTKKSLSEASESIITSLTNMSDYSYVLSDIHTHSSMDTRNANEKVVSIDEPSTSQEKVETLLKFADSMEVLSKSRRINFRKIFCCNPV